uniref:Death domain-containing protein n=1 Tax=Amphimedon queenslandica TaxID=400682 RepID=A0A1X7U9G0_AMPQE
MDYLSGGYDVQFAERHRELAEKYTCVICRMVPKDVHQFTCCGKLVCYSCIENYKRESPHNCPVCRKHGFKYFNDTSLNQEILSLKVFCYYKELGCQWTGELRSLTREHAHTCVYKLVLCEQCGQRVPEKNLGDHLASACVKRMFWCQYCKESGSFEFIQDTHINECPERPIECPNYGCQIIFKRKEIEAHRNVCMHQLVHCCYHPIGCKIMVKRMLKARHEANCRFRNDMKGLSHKKDKEDDDTGELADKLLEKRGSYIYVDAIDYDAVSKWLQEGTVNLTVKRVQMLGPPGSGKTCSQRLLLNEDPPEEAVTDSTPITCRAVKATRISVADGRMERVDVKALLSRLACDLKEAAAKQEETPMAKHDTRPKEKSSEVISISMPIEAKTPESANAADNHDPHSTKICNEILRAIPEAKAKLDRHLVYIIDSGGQTAFQELLPLFTRPASLNIITLDLSKGLDEKLDLRYRIDGTPFPCDPTFSYTNIEFIKDVLSSGAILQPLDTPQSKKALQYPGYFILGTHSDDAKATPQNIKKYNEELSSLKSGSKDKGYYIISAKLGDTNEIIYPVNTMLKSGPERQVEAKNLCETIYDDVSGDVFKIPVRWFAFELTLLEKAEGHSFLQLDDVLFAGKSLQMDEADTRLALQYLHNVTIILYYPQVLPDIVFVDPHPILNILSRLLALTYKIDRRFLRHLTKETPSQSELDNLSKKGIFTKSLLDKLKDDQGFPKSDFIKLLLHLHIIVEMDGGYFIPSALPPCGSTGPPPDSDFIDSLLVVWCNPVTKEILPVPRGIFSLAIINLMTFKQPQFRFPPSAVPRTHRKYFRHRDAMSFRVYVHNELVGTIHFIKKHRHIEIYFESNEVKYCPLICKAVTEAINRSSVAINLKPDGHEFTFDCSTEDSYCIVKKEDEKKAECTLCTKPPLISGQEKRWSWFHITYQTLTEASKTLDITHLQKVLNLLREGHFNGDWEGLGLELGLYQHPTLSNIQYSYTRGAALRECLATWLLKADAVDENGGVTYVSLANAVERLSQKSVADYIRRKCGIDCSQEEIIESNDIPQSKPVPAQDSYHIAEEEEKEKQIAEKTGSSCPWTILLGVVVFMFICVALFAIVGITAYMRIINDEGQAIFDKGNNGWTELEITDLKEILGLLHDGHFPDHRWLDLGIRLKILHTTLTTIEADTNSAHRRLLEMLSLWLRRGKATWSELGTALSEMEEYKSAELVKTRVAKKKHEL